MNCVAVLIAGIVHLADADPRAVIDRGALTGAAVVPGVRSRNFTSCCNRCRNCGFS